MKGDENAVASEMDVGLQVPVSKRYCDLECRERVLGRRTGTTSVGERDRSRLEKERVHVSRSRIPASLTRNAQPVRKPSRSGACLPHRPYLRLLCAHHPWTQRVIRGRALSVFERPWAIETVTALIVDGRCGPLEAFGGRSHSGQSAMRRRLDLGGQLTAGVGLRLPRHGLVQVVEEVQAALSGVLLDRGPVHPRSD